MLIPRLPVFLPSLAGATAEFAGNVVEPQQDAPVTEPKPTTAAELQSILHEDEM